MTSEVPKVRGEQVHTAYPEEPEEGSGDRGPDGESPRVLDVPPAVYVGPEGTYPRGGRGLREQADAILTTDAKRQPAASADAALRAEGVISRNAERDYRARELQMDDALREDGTLRSGPPPTTESRKRREVAEWRRISTDGTLSPTPSTLTEVRTRNSPHYGHAPVARTEGTVASLRSLPRTFELKRLGRNDERLSDELQKRGSMSNDTRTFDQQRNVEMDVFDFMQGVGQATPVSPAIPSKTVTDLRVKLIEEEYDELMEAVRMDNLIEIADGIADLVYVLVGMAIAYGIPFSDVWDEVHRTNMLKVGMAEFREDGKYLKPQAWEPPNITRILLDAASNSLVDQEE